MRGVGRLTAVMGLIAVGPAPAAPANLVAQGGFEGGPEAIAAAGWKLGEGVTVERGPAADGDAFLRCGCVKPAAASAATLPGLAVKPNTGYVARCRFRLEAGAHYTFGVLNADGTFFVCRDVYGGPTPQWNESVLPFRTEQQTRVGVYLARRYGAGAICFDAVELVEDDTVRVGDVSPRPNPFPQLTAEEQARGFVAAPQPWLRLVYPSCYPTRAELRQPLACRLAPGEVEPATLTVTAARALTEVTATLDGDLTGPAGTTLPARAVRLGVVGTMARWLTNGAPLKPGQRFERRPFLIYPNQPFDLPERETRQVWLTVHAPGDQEPGRYDGTLTIRADGRSLPVPIEVHVLPLKLPEAEPTYGMYYRHDHQPEGYRTEDFLTRCLTDMRDHGMNSMSVYANVERTLADGSAEIDLTRDTGRYGLTRQMALLQSAGLATAGHPLLFLAHGKTDGTFHHEDRLVAAVDQLRRERRWPELLFYLVDEPSSAAQIEMAKRLNDVVHKVPGVRTTTAMGRPGELADYYDVWIVSTSAHGNLRELIALAAEKRKELWAYNCQWNGTQPANDRYYCGYYLWATGLRGNWQWCYTEEYSGSSSLKDPVPFKLPHYEDPWYVNYVLPTPEGNLPTLGWEGRREGIDDYRYLQALRDAVAAAAKSKDARKRREVREAEQFLTALRGRLAAPEQPLPATNTGRNYDYVMHPGLSPTDYDDLRRQTADRIIKLRAGG